MFLYLTSEILNNNWWKKKKMFVKNLEYVFCNFLIEILDF